MARGLGQAEQRLAIFTRHCCMTRWRKNSSPTPRRDARWTQFARGSRPIRRTMHNAPSSAIIWIRTGWCIRKQVRDEARDCDRSRLIAAGLGYWAIAQPAPAPLATLIPSGALLFLEAKDFGTLLADWNGSAEKRVWLASANYQAFSRSSLFIKLERAQTEFATAAGVPPDYALLGSVAEEIRRWRFTTSGSSNFCM